MGTLSKGFQRTKASARATAMDFVAIRTIKMCHWSILTPYASCASVIEEIFKE